MKRTVDEWYSLNQKRLALQRQADELEDAEKLLKQIFTQMMRDHKVLKFEATDCVVELKLGEPQPTVRNWELFYKYILENNAFEMLQKRPSAPAIREHWEAGEHIPGVEKFPVDKIAVSHISR